MHSPIYQSNIGFLESTVNQYIGKCMDINDNTNEPNREYPNVIPIEH
jgi:hypothetical protein